MIPEHGAHMRRVLLRDHGNERARKIKTALLIICGPYARAE